MHRSSPGGQKNPSLVFVCDPVLGDGGRLYVPGDLPAIYREMVVPHASILTPNQFELELLAGHSVGTVAEVVGAMAALHARGVPTVVVTSFSLGGCASHALPLPA